jgi:predicted secreted protein
MDPALSSLFPIHQIGSDGFSWWIGQVESEKSTDPKYSGRYRVRVVGTHLKDCDATPTEQLPWAQVMMPVTTPFSDGGVTGATVDLRQGNWVVGFYLDNDRQKPIIMGSIGHTAGATKKSNVDGADPNPGGTCKSFTTFLRDDVNPNLHKPMASSEKRNGDQPAASTTAEDTGVTSPGEAGQIAAAVPGQMPAAFYGLFAEASTTNPTGNKVCVEIANPNCGSENDLKGGLTNIIGEMLKATQQSGGNIGTFYVSKINGELNSYIDHGMEYVNKAVRLVRSFVSRVKGEIVKLIRQGVDKLVDLILFEEVAATDELGNTNTGPVAPDLGVEPFKPITKKQSRLKTIIDTVNDVLDDLGCSMADLTDRLAQWLTDLLLGFLMDAYSNAACLVDTIVNGILNQILAFLEELISTVLGPLQQILSLIASPLDMIGNAIATVLNLLGISCDGPNSQCEKTTKECTDCGSGETEDWLDSLIKQLEDGNLDSSSYVCDEAKNTTALDSLPPTDIIFVGGTFPPGEEDPVENTIPTDIFIRYKSTDIEVTEGEKAKFVIERSGNITTASSLTVTILGGTATQGVDYDKIYTGSSIGFAPGASKKEITFETYKDSVSEGPETFYIKIEPNFTPDGLYPTFPGGNVYKCTINDFDPQKTIGVPFDLPPGTPYIPPALKGVDDIVPGEPLKKFTPLLPTFEVTTDKQYYKEGETITYTITTANVTNLGPYTYTLEGDIIANDIVGGNLTGNFTLDATGQATVTVGLVVNTDSPSFEVTSIDEDGNVTTETVTPVDGIESITFFIEDTPAYATAFILGDDDPLATEATWFVSSDLGYVSEGETVTFTVSTVNVPDGTNFTYKIVGDNITKDDIVGYRLKSSVDFDGNPLQIVNGKCTIPIQIAADVSIEESENFDFIIESYVDEDGVIQLVDDVSTNVIILGDSTTVITPTQVTPAFFVSADKLVYKEGETAIFTITSTNVIDGTVLQYGLYGDNLTNEDFVNNSLFGSFVMIDNTAKVYVGIADDLSIEGSESVTFLISGTGASADIIITDNTAEEPQAPDPNPRKPCFDKPIAGAPITDANGSIISIPIVSTGCPYVFPPKVIITGPGYGASAIALTDSLGRVTEIRVTRSGIGYNLNRPEDSDLRCVIDSYTIISPGVGYTSAPDVYIDGVAGRATAIIDDRGYVVSIQPTDRTTTYNEIPQIKIIGGGGAGARVLPSVVCLDTTEYENQGYAKIGTGRYVDCP